MPVPASVQVLVQETSGGRVGPDHAQSSLIRTGAVVDTLVRTKILQLYSRQGTVQAYRAYKNRPSPKLTWLPFLDLVLNLVQITHTST